MRRGLRREQKAKEIKNLKKRYCRYNYSPTMPSEKEDENGNVYYVQGSPSKDKKWLKKHANKKTRKSKDLSSFAGYKKAYELTYLWY